MPSVVVTEDLAQIADPHVVGLKREVPAVKLALRDTQIAHRGGQRPRRVKAIVGGGAPGEQGSQRPAPGTGADGRDRRGETAAAGEVDVHPEQRLTGRGKDLGQARGGDRIVAGDHLRAASALHEHERLQEVRRDARSRRCAIDQRAQCRHPGGCGRGPARALGEQRLRVAGGGAGDEVGLLGRDKAKQVTASGSRRGEGPRGRRQRATGQGRDDDHDQDDEGQCGIDQPAPALAESQSPAAPALAESRSAPAPAPAPPFTEAHDPVL